GEIRVTGGELPCLGNRTSARRQREHHQGLDNPASASLHGRLLSISTVRVSRQRYEGDGELETPESVLFERRSRLVCAPSGNDAELVERVMKICGIPVHAERAGTGELVLAVATREHADREHL